MMALIRISLGLGQGPVHEIGNGTVTGIAVEERVVGEAREHEYEEAGAENVEEVAEEASACVEGCEGRGVGDDDADVHVVEPTTLLAVLLPFPTQDHDQALVYQQVHSLQLVVVGRKPQL